MQTVSPLRFFSHPSVSVSRRNTQTVSPLGFSSHPSVSVSRRNTQTAARFFQSSLSASISNTSTTTEVVPANIRGVSPSLLLSYYVSSSTAETSFGTTQGKPNFVPFNEELMKLT